MANNKTSDKQISIEQINYMYARLVELKFKDSNPIIQVLMSLKDIETNTTKDTTNKESNKQ